MILSEVNLKQLIPLAKPAKIKVFVEPLQKTLDMYQINTPRRIACFIAQITHESGSLMYVKELASGAAYDTGKLALNLGNTPEADGDGQKYKGRGLIQITGRLNYFALSKALGVDFIANPEKLEEPLYAALSAGWFWNKRSLNVLADRTDKDEDTYFKLITKNINGGYNGLEDRIKHLAIAKKALGL